VGEEGGWEWVGRQLHRCLDGWVADPYSTCTWGPATLRELVLSLCPHVVPNYAQTVCLQPPLCRARCLTSS